MKMLGYSNHRLRQFAHASFGLRLKFCFRLQSTPFASILHYMWHLVSIKDKYRDDRSRQFLLRPDYPPLSVSSFLLLSCLRRFIQFPPAAQSESKVAAAASAAEAIQWFWPFWRWRRGIRTRRSRAAATLAHPSLSPIINWNELVSGGRENIVDFVTFACWILHVISSDVEIFIRTLLHSSWSRHLEC